MCPRGTARALRRPALLNSSTARLLDCFPGKEIATLPLLPNTRTLQLPMDETGLPCFRRNDMTFDGVVMGLRPSYRPESYKYLTFEKPSGSGRGRHPHGRIGGSLRQNVRCRPPPPYSGKTTYHEFPPFSEGNNFVERLHESEAPNSAASPGSARYHVPRLTPEEFQLIEAFLLRRNELAEGVRRDAARGIVRRLSARLELTTQDEQEPEALLETLALAYRARARYG